MKKICFLLAALILTAALISCGESEKEKADTSKETVDAEKAESVSDVTDVTSSPSEANEAKDAKEFTALVRLETDFVEFRLPEDHDGTSFKDMGANCAVTVDRYGNDVAAYHEYDKSAEIEQKTAGNHTFDYQKFNNMGIPDWRMYVIRIIHNNEYYRFIYNVYAEEYDDKQVEKFMETKRFDDED